MKQGFLRTASFLAWILSFLLIVWFLWRSLGVVSLAAARIYLNATAMQWQIGKQGIFAQEMWMIVAGIGAVAAMYFIEAYLRHGAQKGDLWRRAAVVFSIQLFLLFVVDSLTVWLGGYGLSWLNAGALLLELALAFLLLAYARRGWPFRSHRANSV